MFDNLPTELVITIVHCAFKLFIVFDPSTLVSLAQTSRTLHDLIVPHLHHTMVVTHTNLGTVERLTNPDEEMRPAAEQITDRVRVLIVLVPPMPSSRINARIFRNLEHIQAPVGFVQEVAIAERCPLRHIHAWYMGFEELERRLPPSLLNKLTHVSGFPLEPSDEDYGVHAMNPERWLTLIVDCLPALTHLAFDAVLVDSPDNKQACADFDMDVFRQILEAALGYQRLQLVAFRVAGIYVERWGEFTRVGRDLNDQRLRVWRDSRVYAEWQDEEVGQMEDLLQRRTIWTETRPLVDQ